MNYPKIYLAIDNCFASKRWTTPSEWMEISKNIGINYIEASADNECDPLYVDNRYLNDWIKEVLRVEKKTGVKVANLYSGHGSYATLGLAHDDIRNRDHIQHRWLKPMIATAERLNAGLGFFCHAFPQRILQVPKEYLLLQKDLYRRLSELADIASEAKLPYISLEQMYTPHQIPWTIKGAKEMIQDVYNKNKTAMYITIDTGHQNGQKRYLRPTLEELQKAIDNLKNSGSVKNLWLGSETAFEMLIDIATVGASSKYTIKNIIEEMEKHSHLFAEERDCDTYKWLEELGCFSPIIHLQQTDGSRSAHLPFDEENNRNGIIDGRRILQSLAKSYNKNYCGMPKLCNKIYLTLEIFAEKPEYPYKIIEKLKNSVCYWKKFIPEDGLSLDTLL